VTARPRWERCINHRGVPAEAFAREYLASDRRPLVVAGGGFDPRSTRLAKLVAETAGKHASAVLLREQRPDARPELVARADANVATLRGLIPATTVEEFDIFDIDNAPVGGRRATAAISKVIRLDGVTDVILDGSALSVGVLFPVAKYCYQLAAQQGINFHVFVVDDPSIDAAIEAAPCGKASPLHSFQGRISLNDSAEAARLWLPQLGPGRREVLKLVHQLVQPHAVCPILPFPATHPRSPDRLIEEYGDLFEAVSDPFQPTWQVDSRDLVYAHEKSPVDLYRTILRIDDGRRRVFEQTGGSHLILSPLGSKALALGILMAALERDFAVVSVESIAYKADPGVLSSMPGGAAEFVHIWLHDTAQIPTTEIEV
jgi:hypothetical protein